jgi:hypothetical protein
MFKTIWLITDKNDNSQTKLTYYHFGKEPKFPSWYMMEGSVYEIEMLWNFKLVSCFNAFVKCLFHSWEFKFEKGA